MIPRFERRLDEAGGAQFGQTVWGEDGKTARSKGGEEGVQLNVIVVGAGIAGFAAAVGMRRAGHKVKLIEKAGFKREVGLMIALGPNGTKVLNEFGFDYARARAVPGDFFMQYNGQTLESQTRVDTRVHKERYGSGTWIIYRPDLHNELRRLAMDPEAPFPIPELILGAKVAAVNPETGTVLLEDGTSYLADLIIGADGERSVVRQSFKNPGNLRPMPFKTIRTLIPTEDIFADPDLKGLMESQRRCFSMYNDNFHVLAWYEGRDGLLQDVEISYLINRDGSNAPIEADKSLLRTRLLEIVHNYHPLLRKVFSKAPLENISDWHVNTLDPLPSFHQSHALLIGDAAHSMLFTTGQGGCQGLEDAGALSVLFDRFTLPSSKSLYPPFHGNKENIDKKGLVKSRLETFDSVRKDRAHLMQRLSGIRLGKEESYFRKFEPQLHVDGRAMKTTKEHLDWMYEYDVFEESRRALAKEAQGVRALL